MWLTISDGELLNLDRVSRISAHSPSGKVYANIPGTQNAITIMETTKGGDVDTYVQQIATAIAGGVRHLDIRSV